MCASSYGTYSQSRSIMLAPAKAYFYIQCNYKYIYHNDTAYILNTIKYYTVQVTNLYTDASDSQNNHTEVDNIIQMQMTPKIIPVSCRGSQPIITTDLTYLQCEVGVLLGAWIHSPKITGLETIW